MTAIHGFEGRVFLQALAHQLLVQSNRRLRAVAKEKVGYCRFPRKHSLLKPRAPRRGGSPVIHVCALVLAVLHVRTSDLVSNRGT